jgi:transposase-like protein
VEGEFSQNRSARGVDLTKAVAEHVRCSTNTVSKWRARFLESRLDGLVDGPRLGRLPTITAERVEVATLESTPANTMLWSRAMTADHGPVEVHDRANLESVRAETAQGGWLQALQRSAVRGLVIYYDRAEADSISHGHQDVGVVSLDLTLKVPEL